MATGAPGTVGRDSVEPLETWRGRAMRTRTTGGLVCRQETAKWFALRRALDLTHPVTEAPYLPAYEMLALKGAEQRIWHERAAQVAASHFGKQAFVRAVVEVSNFCRENCQYCGMRRDNRSLDRFRGQLETLQELLVHKRPSIVTDVNIQSGEDPIAVREVVFPLIKTLREQTSLGISVCLGTLTPQLYSELQSAGASIYIIKFEMADAHHYTQMQAPGSFKERIDHIHLLANTGWHVSSGFIAGLPGQTPDQLLANFALAGSLPLDGCSVSPFIPGESTPLAASPTADIDLTLNCMAALRLMKPDWVIPAVSALNLAEPGAGYLRGLHSGANLVTINLTPAKVRDDYLLYKRERFIMTEEGILKALTAAGLSPSAQSLADFYRHKESPPSSSIEQQIA
jgi:biotin synthase